MCFVGEFQKTSKTNTHYKTRFKHTHALNKKTHDRAWFYSRILFGKRMVDNVCRKSLNTHSTQMIGCAFVLDFQKTQTLTHTLENTLKTHTRTNQKTDDKVCFNQGLCS